MDKRTRARAALNRLAVGIQVLDERKALAEGDAAAALALVGVVDVALRRSRQRRVTRGSRR